MQSGNSLHYVPLTFFKKVFCLLIMEVTCEGRIRLMTCMKSQIHAGDNLKEYLQSHH